jgi:hypothetical protein
MGYFLAADSQINFQGFIFNLRICGYHFSKTLPLEESEVYSVEMADIHIANRQFGQQILSFYSYCHNKFISLPIFAHKLKNQ